MGRYVIYSFHPTNNPSPTPISNGGALVIYWDPAVELNTFRSIAFHIHFRNKPKFSLKLFLNPSTSEASILNYSQNAYHTFPWTDQHPIVIIKYDANSHRGYGTSDCRILASKTENTGNTSFSTIPADVGDRPLKFEGVTIYTQLGVYGKFSENCKVAGPFTVNVFEGQAATAEAKFLAKELHEERLAQKRTSEEEAAAKDYKTQLREREKAVSVLKNAVKAREHTVLEKQTALAGRESSLDHRDREVSKREVDVVDREKIVADRGRKVAQREDDIAESTQEGQGKQDGSDKAPLSQNLGDHIADYDEMEVAVNAWPTAVMIVLGGPLAASLKKKHQMVMDDWVNARGDSLSPYAYDYLVYSHGVAWPKLIPKDIFLAVRTVYMKLTKFPITKEESADGQSQKRASFVQ